MCAAIRMKQQATPLLNNNNKRQNNTSVHCQSGHRLEEAESICTGTQVAANQMSYDLEDSVSA